MKPPQINFSGFLQQTVLFSLVDMEAALSLMGPLKFYNVSSVQNLDDQSVTLEGFLSFYANYLHGLFSLNQLDEQLLRAMFSLALASGDQFFAKQVLSNNRYLLKPLRSVVQLQPLGLFVSSLDKKLHIKGFSQEAASFGLKFNFATIYEVAASHTIHELTLSDSEYQKFIKLRQFIRKKTKPLIFEYEGEKTITQIRYSESLNQQISKMKFFAHHGLKVLL